MLTLHDTPLLTPGEVTQLRDSLHRPDLPWRRVSECEFALGASSYLAIDEASYRRAATENNQLLLRELGSLYERLVAALTPVLQEAHQTEVGYAEGFGLPGFVRLTDGRKRERWTGAHCDYNVFRALPWNPPLRKLLLDQLASFTVAIEVPSDGAGLLSWDGLSLDSLVGVAREQGVKVEQAAAGLAATNAARFFPYQIGFLVIHSGQVLHDIAPWEGTGNRLTLQGHALVHDDRWKIFW